MTAAPEILFELRGGVGFVRLHRPRALNALTLSLIEAFDARLRAWAGDPAVHAVVVRGAGTAPTAPAAISEVFGRAAGPQTGRPPNCSGASTC